HAWLADDPEDRHERLARLLAAGALVFTLISATYWTRDAVNVVALEGFGSPRLWEMRNSHPLGHSNYTAGALLLSLPWLVARAYRGDAWGKWIWTAAALLALALLFTTGSRGGLLGLGALVVTGILQLRWKRSHILLAL